VQYKQVCYPLHLHKWHFWGINVLGRVVKLCWRCTKWKLKFLLNLSNFIRKFGPLWRSEHSLYTCCYDYILWQANISIFKLWIIIYIVSRCFKGRFVRLNQTYSRLRALLVHPGPSWHFPVDRFQQDCEGRNDWNSSTPWWTRIPGRYNSK